jgi:hypothetical protein
MNREEYEKELKQRQEKHLKNIRGYWNNNQNWCPCLHDSCPECIGTGFRHDGSMCIHNISCPCPKCSFTC